MRHRVVRRRGSWSRYRPGSQRGARSRQLDRRWTMGRAASSRRAVGSSTRPIRRRDAEAASGTPGRGGPPRAQPDVRPRRAGAKRSRGARAATPHRLGGPAGAVRRWDRRTHCARRPRRRPANGSRDAGGIDLPLQIIGSCPPPGVGTMRLQTPVSRAATTSLTTPRSRGLRAAQRSRNLYRRRSIRPWNRSCRAPGTR